MNSPTYRRRTLLALGSSLLAGCATPPNQTAGPENQSRPDATAPRSDAPESTVTDVASGVRFPQVIAEPDAVADGREVSVAVESERSFTESAPARVVVRFTNTAETAQEFVLGASPPYSDYVGTHVDEWARLVLVPDAREDTFAGDPAELTTDDETETATRYRLVPTEPIGGCWYAGGVVGSAAVRELTELQPGETITERYTLLGHPLNERCLPLGEYRFEDEGYFGDDGSWGFSISLTEPES